MRAPRLPGSITAGSRASPSSRARPRRLAKLAGAPTAPAAGLDLHVRVGDRVIQGQPLFTVHAEAPGELAYALDYLATQNGIVMLEQAG